ncbi:hypothetical protein DTO013E5_9013 [Penicillium roqueforti]|uniref:Dimeric alpha-beta barrel n=1 Tax=Penicillium roqueforti (strain FM164) TaxID=1365484 RepID=W6PVJ7_PENRF|nr:uncharacterized protein LCP9604111_7224 [Penicillium roqueforti]CDM27930.1 Dimeric alpha-beta barrel [Penicillium roqueforti FM164]KAF9244832.1 hypothetical protein LCP9604111_7224 [Penicillium roqueforti]KAI1831148.1 hypothetical protein CBS147337_7906 [Penicillium roqueforti]KAI2680892.1 hypothetical protein LCP963914a_6843 [Penicillium roqueforti]KAI2690541.1 hypothetical protein CBS147355_992 [Penicillium roqueforti]
MPLRLTRVIQSKVPAFPHARQPFLRVPPSHFFSSCPSASIKPSLVPRKSILAFQARNMSSAPAKREFLCILPDKPGAQAKRLEVRPNHLEGVKPHVASGTIVAAGAMLNAHPADGETPSFKGSMVMAVAENEAQVLELLNNDIYTTTGVWDMEKAQIIPFKSAVRQAL